MPYLLTERGKAIEDLGLTLNEPRQPLPCVDLAEVEEKFPGAWAETKGLLAARVKASHGALVMIYLATYEERLIWQDREDRRIRHNQAMALPSSFQVYTSQTWYHFPYLSFDFPGKIGYTPNDQYGQEDRRLVLTPGRYFKRFADKPEFMIPALLDEIVARICTLTNSKAYEFTTDPDTIARVYHHGPGSCMDRKHFSDIRYNPTRAYGGGDLALAYMGPIDHATARCIVWPDRQIYGRVYGDIALTHMLRRAGYEEGNRSEFDGARLSVQKNPDGIIMAPYSDIGEAYSLQEQYLILHGTRSAGTYLADRQDGILDPEDEKACYVCSHCEDRPVGEDGDLCDFCYSESCSCDFCYERFWLECDTIDERTSCGCVGMFACENCDTQWFNHPCHNDRHVGDYCTACAESRESNDDDDTTTESEGQNV